MPAHVVGAGAHRLRRLDEPLQLVGHHLAEIFVRLEHGAVAADELGDEAAIGGDRAQAEAHGLEQHQRLRLVAIARGKQEDVDRAEEVLLGLLVDAADRLDHVAELLASFGQHGRRLLADGRAGEDEGHVKAPRAAFPGDVEDDVEAFLAAQIAEEADAQLAAVARRARREVVGRRDMAGVVAHHDRRHVGIEDAQVLRHLLRQGDIEAARAHQLLQEREAPLPHEGVLRGVMVQHDVMAEQAREADEQEIVADAEAGLEYRVEAPARPAAAAQQPRRSAENARHAGQMILEAELVRARADVADLDAAGAAELRRGPGHRSVDQRLAMHGRGQANGEEGFPGGDVGEAQIDRGSRRFSPQGIDGPRQQVHRDGLQDESLQVLAAHDYLRLHEFRSIESSALSCKHRYQAATPKSSHILFMRSLQTVYFPTNML